jgi:hypothetical protein
MRRMALVWTVLLLSPLAARAQWGNPSGMGGYAVDSSLKFHFQVVQSGTQLGPWYLYWPLEAHFVRPAPPAYPFWPQGGGNYPVFNTGAPPGGGPPGPGNFGAPVPPRPTTPMPPPNPPAPSPNTYAPQGPGYYEGYQTVPVVFRTYSPPYYYGR